MHRFSIALALSTVLLTSICSAQQTATTAVPNLIRYGGTLKDVSDAAISSATVGVTFAIYKQQEGGAPVWQETQNVVTDANGDYSVLLGSTTATGLPSDLFSQQEQRWLGVQVQGEVEQARVLLVSVPYAFRAQEAETLGGLAPSAFVLAAPSSRSESVAGKAGQALIPGAAPQVGGSGSTNYIAKWTSGTDLGNSNIYQLGSNVGIGTTTPGSTLDVAGNVNVGNTNTYRIGQHAVLSTLGTSNLFLGLWSGQHNATGQKNTFTGYAAGYSNTTGMQNTATGYNAGYNNTGSGNTFTGSNAGFSNTTGSFNTFLGYWAGKNNTTGSRDVYIANTGPATGTESNAIRIGDPAVQTAAYIAGIHGNSPGGAIPVVINSSGQLGTSLQVPAGSPNYIQNGNTLQTGANFNIDGNGTLGGPLTIDGFGFTTFSVTPQGFVSATNVSVNANEGIGPTLALTATGGDDPFTGGDAAHLNAGSANVNEGTGGNGVVASGGNGGFSDSGNGGTGGVFTGGSGVSYGGAGGVFRGGSGTVFGGVGGGFAGGFPAGDGVDAASGGPGAYAGNFNGDVNVSGALFASTKDFKIDHPLDPANKYLYHASVESSEMLNIYTGNVVLDGAGQAEVRVAEWFEAVNTDFRYQLTSIGAPGPSLYIAKEIADGSFKIAGGQPSAKVSWQITAVRQDAYAKANPLVIEQAKPTRERGFYIHPELYGASPAKGIEWARNPKLMETIKQMRAQSRHEAGSAKRSVSRAPTSGWISSQQ